MAESYVVNRDRNSYRVGQRFVELNSEGFAPGCFPLLAQEHAMPHKGGDGGCVVHIRGTCLSQMRKTGFDAEHNVQQKMCGTKYPVHVQL